MPLSACMATELRSSRRVSRARRYGGHGFLAFVRGLAIGDHTLHAHVKGTLEGTEEGLDGTTKIKVVR